MDNIMWNSYKAKFQMIDFGLSVRKNENFHHRLFNYGKFTGIEI